MINGRRQSGWNRLLARPVENRSVKIGADMHRSAGNDDRAAMNTAGAMRTRRFLVLRVRLRTLRNAMIAAQISYGISHDIARKRAQGDEASQREHPRGPTDVHRISLLAFSLAAVKPQLCSRGVTPYSIS